MQSRSRNRSTSARRAIPHLQEAHTPAQWRTWARVSCGSFGCSARTRRRTSRVRAASGYSCAVAAPPGLSDATVAMRRDSCQRIAASRGGVTAAPIQAAACGPGGLIALVHEPPRPHDQHPTISIWSAPAVGLQTPRRLAAVRCDKPVRGGAAAVGFAGGADAPFVWVAERPGPSSTVFAVDWRAASGVGAKRGGGKGTAAAAADGGGASDEAVFVAWVPGGPGRRLASVVSDGAGCDLAACGTSFLTFLSLSRAPAEDTRGRVDGAAHLRRLRDESYFAVKQPWHPAAPWDVTTNVPPEYAIGMGDMGDGFRGRRLEYDAVATRRRDAMPPPTDAARFVRGSAASAHAATHKAVFARAARQARCGRSGASRTSRARAARTRSSRRRGGRLGPSRRQGAARRGRLAGARRGRRRPCLRGRRRGRGRHRRRRRFGAAVGAPAIGDQGGEWPCGCGRCHAVRTDIHRSSASGRYETPASAWAGAAAVPRVGAVARRADGL